MDIKIKFIIESEEELEEVRRKEFWFDRDYHFFLRGFLSAKYFGDKWCKDDKQK